MHWWQTPFSALSRSHSEDDIIVGAGGGRESTKPGFFSSRWHRNLARARKLSQLKKNDADSWRLHSNSEHSRTKSASALPQPLPMPELHPLLRNDPKVSTSSSFSVPLPSPDANRNHRGVSEKERERGKAEGLNAGGVYGLNGLNRLSEHTQTNGDQFENQISRKSPIKQYIIKERSLSSRNINIPISAPTSPYASPVLSPRRSDMMANYYFTPPGIFQVWSAPDAPYSDGNMGLSFNYRMPFEKKASSVDNSPLQSPRVSSHFPLAGLPTKISSETSVARWESNAQATVHPLPLPPGASMPSQPNSNFPIASTSDFSGASMPLQPTSISIHAAKPEFPGANLPAQTSPISQVAGKPEPTPLKSQWQKGKLIGRGTFGSVYVASNRETGALCAMKEVEILPDDLKSAESMRQLQQEIKVLSNLKHPNIVQYYGSKIVGDKFYIYLEYVHPGSINKFFHDHCGAITESVVRNFTRHILCGLAYLHSTKTIHRDIKGANLLVDGYGVVKLADFGMAKHLNGQAANLSLKGSPYWIAPELLQPVTPKDANADVGLAVDIWSLGCTIIEMMNGKPPWSEYEGAAALFKVLKESPPIPETLSAEGKDFLQRCFRRNPAERPTASELLDHPFVNSSSKFDATTYPKRLLD
ncbi:hypothetical protein ACS0TY_006190 [Phlomoides rotata]